MESALINQTQLAYQATKAIPKLGRADTEAQARKTAVEFEAFFLGQMLQPMFANIDTAPPFGGGHSEKIWRSMMVDEFGKSMAEAGGIGIADSIQREILRLQEVEQ